MRGPVTLSLLLHLGLLVLLLIEIPWENEDVELSGTNSPFTVIATADLSNFGFEEGPEVDEPPILNPDPGEAPETPPGEPPPLPTQRPPEQDAAPPETQETAEPDTAEAVDASTPADEPVTEVVPSVPIPDVAPPPPPPSVSAPPPPEDAPVSEVAEAEPTPDGPPDPEVEFADEARPQPEPVVDADVAETAETDPESDPIVDPVDRPEPDAPDSLIPEVLEATEEAEVETALSFAPPTPGRRPDPPPAPEPAQVADAAPEPPPAPATNTENSGSGARTTTGRPSRLSPGDENLVREAIRPCWNIDPGALGGRDIQIGIRVEMTQDGRPVRGSAQLLNYVNDQVWIATAQRALRALDNPACQPWPLPASRWPDWQVIEFIFDPRAYF